MARDWDGFGWDNVARFAVTADAELQRTRNQVQTFRATDANPVTWSGVVVIGICATLAGTVKTDVAIWAFKSGSSDAAQKRSDFTGYAVGQQLESFSADPTSLLPSKQVDKTHGVTRVKKDIAMDIVMLRRD